MPIWRGTTNSNWGTATNWDTGVLPSATLAGTDAIFDAASPACTVNVAGVCRNLNFTGYANTITMNNTITVGSSSAANANHSVTLSASPSFVVAGTSALITRANGITTLTSNGKTWPNAFSINTVTVATNSTITLASNWVVSGNVIIGTGASSLTLGGSFSLTCNANLTINAGVAQNSVLNSTAALSTIVLAGNSTYTANAASVGVNLTINAPGNTVTLADGASWGGYGTQATSAFTYVAGTVTCTGTFHLNFSQSGTAYTVNISGSTSPSATTTSTTGVNFSNLSLKTAAATAPNNCTFSTPICVVNDLSVTTTSGTKSAVLLTGSTLYANKSFALNGYISSGSTTIIRLQGTGTWSESLTLSSASTNFGSGTPIVINTAGTITLTSFVGIRSNSITYTAGSVVTTGFGFRLLGATVNGFGSGGIPVETVYHSSGGTILTALSAITINDSAPFVMGTLSFDGFSTTNAHKYLGTAGWTCNTLYYQQTSTAGGCDIGLVAETSIVYKINTSLTLRAWNSIVPRSNVSKNTGAATRAIFTLVPGASQDVFYIGGTSVDSSAGQTIWSRKGLLTSTINWSLWTYPKTRFSTFTN